MEYATVTGWLKAEGDRVSADEPVVEVEADKANHEIAAPVEGVIREILAVEGVELRLMMAEITGRATGYCRGKGGSMHITAMRHGMLGADAIVGGSLAIAVGAAYTLRLQGRDAVTVAFFGDGASNQGIFHEAANLASVLSAPVIFVCENNQWAISTPIRSAINVEDVAIRAQG